MKKLIIGIVCLGLFWQSAFSSDVKEFSVKNFNKKLLAYTYIPKTKKCMPTKPAHQDIIASEIRRGNIDVLEVYDSVPGQLTIIRMYNDYGYNEMVMTSTYGACLMYIDDNIEKIEIEDPEYYVGLHYAK